MKSAHQFSKHFTLAEAQSLLPQLRSILRDAHRRRDAVSRADEKLGELLQSTHSDLGGPLVTGLLMDLAQTKTQLQQIQDMGVQIKDFDRGLLDFPHIRDGREVFLCWELEEDDIEFWHDIDCGYSDRERL